MGFISELKPSGQTQDAAADCLFSFDGPDGRIVAQEPAFAVERGPAATLPQRLAALDLAADEIIGGAMPFDKSDDDCLWRARRTSAAPHEARRTAASEAFGAAAAPRDLLPLREFALSPQPWAADYAAMVREALSCLAANEAADTETGTGKDLDGYVAGALKKIVLARSLLIESPQPIPVAALLARLGHDPAATAFRVRLPAPKGGSGAERHLVGATPELLLQKTGDLLRSHPLAGSAKRAQNGADDQMIAEALSQSEKDRREHRYVVDYILDTLAPYCRELSAPRGTEITRTASMWHLGTEIAGRLRDPATPSAVLASILHPTPAICGVPPKASARLINELEPVRRGFYAGAVGWSKADGDGAWYVAIRCADICGTTARLFAGAGIVLGSEPLAEAAETGAKFGALLAALGLPADMAVAGLLQSS